MCESADGMWHLADHRPHVISEVKSKSEERKKSFRINNTDLNEFEVICSVHTSLRIEALLRVDSTRQKHKANRLSIQLMARILLLIAMANQRFHRFLSRSSSPINEMKIRIVTSIISSEVEFFKGAPVDSSGPSGSAIHHSKLDPAHLRPR